MLKADALPRRLEVAREAERVASQRGGAATAQAKEVEPHAKAGEARALKAAEAYCPAPV